MPPRFASRNKGKGKARNQRPIHIAPNDLKAITLASTTTTSITPPNVPDVPMMAVKVNKVYTISREFTASSPITGSTIGPSAYSYAFTLNSLPDYTDFTTLFDQYRVIQATVMFQARTGTLTYGNLYSVIDYDDANNLASVNEALQYPSCLIAAPGSTFQRTLNPQFTMAAYSGAFTSYTLAQKRQWIDVASPAVQYYGLKVVLEQTSSNNIGWDVRIRMVVQFRNPR